MSSEQEIAIVNGLFTVGFSRIDYVLHLTSERFIAIHATNLGAQGSQAQVAGGLVGLAIAKGFQKVTEGKRNEKEKALQGLTLDELLQTDKKSFAIPNNQIVAISLRRGFTGGEIYLRQEKATKRFSVEKIQVDAMVKALKEVYGQKFALYK